VADTRKAKEAVVSQGARPSRPNYLSREDDRADFADLGLAAPGIKHERDPRRV